MYSLEDIFADRLWSNSTVRISMYTRNVSIISWHSICRISSWIPMVVFKVDSFGDSQPQKLSHILCSEAVVWNSFFYQILLHFESTSKSQRFGSFFLLQSISIVSSFVLKNNVLLIRFVVSERRKKRREKKWKERDGMFSREIVGLKIVEQNVLSFLQFEEMILLCKPNDTEK